MEIPVEPVDSEKRTIAEKTPQSPRVDSLRASTKARTEGTLPGRKIEWREVERESEVLTIGDLNGSYEAFIKNLESLHLIDNEGNWIGGNRKLVFLGDILGDRHPEGIQIVLKIRNLRLQASRSNGKIVVIMGNHDDWAVSYITGQKVAGRWSPSSQAGGYTLAPSWPAKGLIEFQNKFGLKKFKELREAFGESAVPQKELLRKMREHPEGKQLLWQICEMKLVEKIDDTLFVHANPSAVMLSKILELGVDNLNSIYQQGLRQLLFKGVNPSEEWYVLRNIFLSTWARKNFDDPTSIGFRDPQILSEEIRNSGVNHIVYGHDDYPEKYYEINGLSIINSDHSAFKTDPRSDNKRSITVIGRDGGVRCGADLGLKRRGKRGA